MAEFRVPIKDQELVLVFSRKRFSQLLRDPQATRMLGDVEVQNAPAIMSDHQEAVENAEREGWDSEEIHRRQDFTVIIEKCFPTSALVRLPWRATHPSRDRSLREFKPKLQKFPMNARCAPSRILSHHLQDERP